ncbi:unnamed protein product [Candida verbasci]|uniref:Chloride channel protein n=1 Tax=Candida verbasci TaxID=1227364 RepID=A0A9W4XAY1_9ASCO|nr:unnamed protein product [Candida verbasci]
MSFYQQSDESTTNTSINNESSLFIRNKYTSSEQTQLPQTSKFDQFRTIDWVEDELDEQKQRILKIRTIHSQSINFKDKILPQIQNWVILAIMGIIIGLIAGCLNIITSWLSNIKTGHCSSNFYLNQAFCCWGYEDEEKCNNWSKWTQFEFINYVIYVLISLFMAGISAKLVQFYAPNAAGSGISEIKCIVSGSVMDGFLGWKTLVIKSLGLPLAIGSGLSLGKEGPSVHYAVCVGNSIAKLIEKYRKSASKGREFLTATSAAGVAVAFGSPMGGVLFSVEEISSIFQLSTLWKSYFCALIAVTTLAAMNPFRNGQLVLFEVSYDTNWHYFEIPVYIILGIFGGIYGILVPKFNIRVVSFRKRYLANFAIREVLILTLLTTSFSYFNQFLKIDMTESMQILFHECDKTFAHPICDPNRNKAGILVSLLFATVARMGLTIITYGCKVPAGIFVPSMAAGACFGRAMGIIVDFIYRKYPDSSIFQACHVDETLNGKCIIPGTYAFLGAAAGLCGITDLTVTVVIIMFELTGALRYIVPTMIVVAITKSITDKWGKGGIADQMIEYNGLPLIDSKKEFKFGVNVDQAMTKETITFSMDHNDTITYNEIRQIFQKSDIKGFPIIYSSLNPKIYGYISRHDINYILTNYFHDKLDEKIDFSEPLFQSIINKSPLRINIETTLEYVLDIFVKLGPRYILIEDDSNLVGIITRKDILRYSIIFHHKVDSVTEMREKEIEEKVWEFMNLLSTSARKNLGKLIYNDANRFL